MKMSISLSDPAAETLRELAKARKSNASVVLEASLLSFAEMPEPEQLGRIRELQNLRRATTRDGWMHVFWEALAEAFGSKDFDFTGQGNPMAPRNHAGFCFVFLYDERNPLSGPIYVHTFQSPAGPDNRALLNNWQFDKGENVYGCARKVAAWVKQQLPHQSP